MEDSKSEEIPLKVISKTSDMLDEKFAILAYIILFQKWNYLNFIFINESKVFQI